MFAHLLRAPESESNRPRNTVRLVCERLEDRTVPAADFTVNTATDTPDVVGDMKAEDANGKVSLRAVLDYVVEVVNNVPDTRKRVGDWNTNKYEIKIDLPAGSVISLTGGPLPELTSNYNILGTGVTIERPANAPGQFRLFQVNKGTVSRFFDMTLRNGAVIGAGGAIQNLGETKAENCTFVNNYAFDGGGAIGTFAGSKLTVTNCTLGLNTASGAGGAIASVGAASLVISGSSILGNKVTGNGAAQGFGGGVFIDRTASATIEDTNIIGNETTQMGGGICVIDSALTMNRGQLHGNIASKDGGGIHVNAKDMTVTLSKVAVTQNSAGRKGGGAYILNGTLAGELTVFTGNTATVAYAGGAFDKGNGASAPITVPADEQKILPDE